MTAPAVDALFSAFRNSEYLNVTLSAAAQLLAISRRQARDLAESTPELELQRRDSANGPFYVIRAVLSADNVARLAPVHVERLRKVYGWNAEGRQALEQVLALGGENGPFHIVQGEVRPGPGASEAVQLAQPGGRVLPAPAVYQPAELDEAEDLRVLSHLEDLEADRINFGVYDTFVSLNELQARIQAAEPWLRSAADAVELGAALERLRTQQFVLSPAPGRWRSRVSETVRVLRRVKQRFSDSDAGTAPHLVHSVRVHFQDRKRLERKHPLPDVLETVFQQNRSPGRRIDKPRRALEAGMAVSRNLDDADPAKFRLTRIQKDALEEIGRRYLARDGKGFVITGNTGSGKTEAALLPLFLGAMEEKLRAPEGLDGCKVLLVYPRQELAKNQLQRICKYLAYVNRELVERGGDQGALTAGIVFGDTPFKAGDLERWEETDGGRRLPYFVNEQDGPVTLGALSGGVGVLRSTPGGFADGGWELEGFRATRDAILGSPPDVLVITT